MKINTFLTVASSIFTLVALAHLSRIIMGFDLEISGWMVPIWVNTIAFFIAGLLAFWGVRLQKKNKAAARGNY